MNMVMCPSIRTTLSGLYRHRRDLELHGVGYIRKNLHSWLPSLPSTPRRVQSGHGYSLRPSCLHSPPVRPIDNRPDARGPLSPGLPHCPPPTSAPPVCSPFTPAQAPPRLCHGTAYCGGKHLARRLPPLSGCRQSPPHFATSACRRLSPSTFSTLLVVEPAPLG